MRFWIFFFAFFVMNCKTEFADPFDISTYGYDYYPLEVGKQWTYLVDSIQFDIGSNNLPISDTVQFYIREEIKEIIKDQLDQDLYRIERYRSFHPNGPWQSLDVVTASRTTNQGFRSENNLRFINLVFPIENNVKWDGLAYVDKEVIIYIKGENLELLKGWDFQILEVAERESIGPNDYQDVVTVQQANEDFLIELRYSIEKYARGVGVVYRERKILDSYCKYIGITEPCRDKTWDEKAGRGYITKETLINYR